MMLFSLKLFTMACYETPEMSMSLTTLEPIYGYQEDDISLCILTKNMFLEARVQTQTKTFL